MFVDWPIVPAGLTDMQEAPAIRMSTLKRKRYNIRSLYHADQAAITSTFTECTDGRLNSFLPALCYQSTIHWNPFSMQSSIRRWPVLMCNPVEP
jgi:hypothetical protein